MSYTDQSAPSSSTNTISAFFDSRTDADNAIDRLATAGIPRSSMQVVVGSSGEAASTQSEVRGFWTALENFFFPDEDRKIYAEGLRRGGYLVTLAGYPFDLHDAALDILDDNGSIDLDERARAWEAEGWSRTANVDDPAVTPFDSADILSSESVEVDGDADKVVPFPQEEPRIGKRDVTNGRVRVRSYLMEAAVNSDASLQNVVRSIDAAGGSFVDRTTQQDNQPSEAVYFSGEHGVDENEVEILDDRSAGGFRKNGTFESQRD